MDGGDSRIGGPSGNQSYFPGQPPSVEDTLLEKLHAGPPYDSFQLTTDFFKNLSPDDAKNLFDQLNVFNDLSTQFNDEFDGPQRRQLLDLLQSKFEIQPEQSPNLTPQTFNPKAGGGMKGELEILGSLREAQVSALLDNPASGGKVFKTRDEALAFAGGVNSKNTAVFEDQNHQWHAVQPNRDQWIQGRKDIHTILENIKQGKVDPQEGREQLTETYRKTLAAALGVSPAEINVVSAKNPPDPNKINFDPNLKGKEGTAGAAKLDGTAKSIVLGPDAIAMDNPFDTIDVVSHEASHVRLADEGNKLLAQWQNVKGNKPSFPKWLEAQYKNHKISAEVLVVTSSAYKGGSAASEATSYINGFITAFSQDRASYQKALGFDANTKLIDSALAQAAKFTPESFDLKQDENAALQKDLMKKLQDFYKSLDGPGQARFDAALAKAKHDYPKSWLANFQPVK